MKNGCEKMSVIYKFINYLELTGKVHELHIAFANCFQYNKEDIYMIYMFWIKLYQGKS